MYGPTPCQKIKKKSQKKKKSGKNSTCVGFLGTKKCKNPQKSGVLTI